MTFMTLESGHNYRNNGVANSDGAVSACHVDFCKYLLVYCESFREPLTTDYSSRPGMMRLANMLQSIT